MAGSQPTVPTNNGVQGEIETPDPFGDMLGTLGEILQAVTTRSEDEMQLDLVGGQASQMHAKLRTAILVFSCDAAANIVLTVGTRRFTYNLPGADTRVVPLALVLDRGIDVTITASAGNLYAYIIGTRE